MKAFDIYYISQDRKLLRQVSALGWDRWDALERWIRENPTFLWKAEHLFATESPIGTLDNKALREAGVIK